MNARLKKRLIAVSGIVIIALIVTLAIVGGGTAAQSVSIKDALENTQAGQKIQVSGNVVPNSFSTNGNILTFAIYNPEVGETPSLQVRYDGAASSTFGNDVTAICTGRINGEGVLDCSELVTKCPSKYESATNALSLEQLFEYGTSIEGKTVKVAGTVKRDSLQPAGGDVRFMLVGSNMDETTEGIGAHEVRALPVKFDGALSNEVASGSKVVITGAVDAQGYFVATDVALEG